MSTTVIACIQQVPQGDTENPSGDDTSAEHLSMQELSATGDDYLSAVDAVERQVPDGWRVLYVRAEDAPVPTAPPAGQTADDQGDADQTDAADESNGPRPDVGEASTDKGATASE